MSIWHKLSSPQLKAKCYVSKRYKIAAAGIAFFFSCFITSEQRNNRAKKPANDDLQWCFKKGTYETKNTNGYEILQDNIFHILFHLSVGANFKIQQLFEVIFSVLMLISACLFAHILLNKKVRFYVQMLKKQHLNNCSWWLD